MVFLGHAFLSILCIIGTYIGVALLATIIPINTRYRQTLGGVTCYLCSDGIHTDFVVPTANAHFDWRGIIDPADYEIDLNDGSFLGIGWGDKGFYLDIPTWNDLTFSVAAKALLMPSKSLMHIIAYTDVPIKKKCVELHLSAEEYLILCAYITQFFKLNAENEVVHLPDVGYTPNDQFYESNASYHALNTCNYWINKGLIKTGVRTSVWAPMDWGIFYQLQRIT